MAVTATNQSTVLERRQDVVVLYKPKGEAGDRRNGFNLREAMGMEGEEQKANYLAVVVRDESRHKVTD